MIIVIGKLIGISRFKYFEAVADESLMTLYIPLLFLWLVICKCGNNIWTNGKQTYSVSYKKKRKKRRKLRFNT